MREVILIKNGELALKGMNRASFEDVLIKNIKRKLKDLGEIKVIKAQSTIAIEPCDDSFDMNEAAERMACVFGIVGFSRAAVAKKDMADIMSTAVTYLEDELRQARTFKVEAKRSDKSFPLKSPEICRDTGAYILENYPHLTVDVKNPDVVVTVEVRDINAYVRGTQQKGAGGMPVGTGGRGAILISGGIDSPVAAWMMAKRGLELVAIHFSAPPYTSEQAEDKVMTLLRKVARYSGRIPTFVVNFTKAQQDIMNACDEEYFTIIMRRMMMKVAERLCAKEDCQALVTGESLGQVASQTIHALACTDAATALPVFRPCIGMDKDEIVRISRNIDTFETSILPYEDCCTVFVPKHPRLRPTLEKVLEQEKNLDVEALIEQALADTNFRMIKA
ncbi:MAG: tRNA 4-thiouridine(8) synthase ThiI [Clostridia bacterium]|nr:tRNA 4-thiouridine(8) synthase ThiI [Clostridia bacterium]